MLNIVRLWDGIQMVSGVGVMDLNEVPLGLNENYLMGGLTLDFGVGLIVVPLVIALMNLDVTSVMASSLVTSFDFV